MSSYTPLGRERPTQLTRPVSSCPVCPLAQFGDMGIVFARADDLHVEQHAGVVDTAQLGALAGELAECGSGVISNWLSFCLGSRPS